MPHLSPLFLSDILAVLRDATLSGPVESDAHVLPDIYFNWDTEQGDVQLEITSEPGMLMNIQAKVAKPPRWFSLNLSLGSDQFTVGDVIGLVAELESSPDLSLTSFIRSSDKGEWADTELEERLPGTTLRAVQTVLHTVEPGDGLPWNNGYHTLILRLPPQDFRIQLWDMRFFVLPQNRGLRDRPATLADAAR